MVESQVGFGLISGLGKANAVLEQFENTSPEIGSAAALPVSVSRHLVSTSVQFGQSAAGKTESDQWPSRLSVCQSELLPQFLMLASVQRWSSSAERVARTNLEYIVGTGVPDA